MQEESELLKVITTHPGMDFDALASLVAAKKLYPEAKICLPRPISSEVKQFMAIYGKIIPHLPAEEVELSKVTQLILVDTRWVNRIGPFRELLGKEGVKVHIYDHHPPHPNDIRGDQGLCQEVGATTSILTGLLKQKKIPITPIEATLLILGIYEDTGSLSFTSTTPLDLEAAGFLLSQGASLELISGFLNRPLTERQMALFNDFIERAKIRIINGVEVIIIVTEVDEFVGGLSLPLHKFIDLKNLEVVFALIKARERIYIIARSRTLSVNVSETLSPLGGGGHNFAASALIKEQDIKEVEERLYGILKEKIKPRQTVRDVMSFPVIFVSPRTSLKEAKDLMIKYGISTLPVLERGEVAGIISREKVDHVMAHNSGKAPLKSYLSPKVFTVSPHLSLKKAQEIMMDEETRTLLVLDNEKLVGILKGSDLLHAFHKSTQDFRHSESSFPEREFPGSGEPRFSFADLPKDKLRLRGISEEKGQVVRDLLERKIPKRIQKVLEQGGRVAQRMGFRAFIVGGFVRDLLLGIENLDVDLVIEGDGIEFATELARQLKGELKRHRGFGTATIVLPDGFKLDVATSRSEFYPRPAALPQVKPAPLSEDLARRDFTVNTMAIDINPSNFGLLIDFFGGQEDMRQRKVRVLHPRSFIEDPTRVFRAIRFEQRYGFQIGKETEKLMKDVLKRKIFPRLSRERIREELVQILKEDEPEKTIKRLQDFRILKAIYPKIELTPQKEKELNYLVDVFAHFEVLSKEKSKRWLIRLLLLLEDLDEEEVRDFCGQYKFTREDQNAIISGRLEAQRLIRSLRVPEPLKSSFIHSLLRSVPQEALLFTMAKAQDKLVKKRILLYLTRLRLVEIEVDGKDLKSMGYKPSPRFSQILEEVRRARLDGLVKNKKEEINHIKEKFPPEEKK
jgi:tRNA nucleotidyltransferase (CCA-adding enzyme)